MNHDGHGLMVNLPQTPALFLQGVQKTYKGGFCALRDIGFCVDPGERIAVVGPSGCGKSTLLRLIAGLEEPTAGQVLIFGSPPRKSRGKMAFVFQEPCLLPWRSALGNVLLPLELLHGQGGQEKKTLRENALALLARVGLQGFAHALPHTLSLGMQMRVSLARALVSRPEILLLDEPFASLDVPTSRALRSDVSRLADELRTTLVLVTHDPEDAVELAGRALVMRPGQIISFLDFKGKTPEAAQKEISLALPHAGG